MNLRLPAGYVEGKAAQAQAEVRESFWAFRKNLRYETMQWGQCCRQALHFDLLRDYSHPGWKRWARGFCDDNLYSTFAYFQTDADFPGFIDGIFAPSKCRPFDRIAPVVEKLSAVAISDRLLAMSQHPAKSFSWLVFYRLTKAHTGDPVCFGRLSLGAVLYDHGHD